jgi:hypothetical protein
MRSFYPAARGQLGGEDGGSDMFHGHVCRLPCYLMLEFADKVFRLVICSDWLTKPYFITKPTN